MSKFSFRRSRIPSTGLSTARFRWLTSMIAIMMIAMILHFSSLQVVYAQNADCGEPERGLTVEGQTVALTLVVQEDVPEEESALYLPSASK